MSALWEKRCAHAERNVVNANEQWTMSVRKAQTERKVNSERKMNDKFVKKVITKKFCYYVVLFIKVQPVP